MISPFTSLLPHLDLHGESKDISLVLLKEFITDNIKIKNKTIVVIHGNGKGTLKKAVNEYLKTDKRVYKYYIDGYNEGQTIIELKE